MIANGLQLTEALIDPLEAAEEDGVEVLRIAEQLDPIDYEGDGGHDHADEEGQHSEEEGHDHSDEDGEHADEEGHDHADEEGHDHADEDGEHADEVDHEGHSHGPEDPHVWLDPVRMADAAPLIAEHLAEIDDALDDEEWTTRGAAVADDILAAHDEIETLLADVSDECRQMVTNHEAFGYFAARYDVEVIGTIIPGTTTQMDPSAQDFAELAELLRETEVSAIFAETSSSTRLAESLAQEVGRDIAVVELYTESLGEPGSGAETYTGMIVTNADRIAEALASC